jgi:hypothetical protein
MKKVLLIGIVAGAVEAIIWYILSEQKDKTKLFLLLFTLYTIAYIVVAELERNIPEDGKYEKTVTFLPSFFSPQ